jgi:hypothetical protein
MSTYGRKLFVKGLPSFDWFRAICGVLANARTIGVFVSSFMMCSTVHANAVIRNLGGGATSSSGHLHRSWHIWLIAGVYAESKPSKNMLTLRWSENFF